MNSFLSRSTIADKFKLQTKAHETGWENYFKKHEYEIFISVAHSNTALSFLGIVNVIIHRHNTFCTINIFISQPLFPGM